MYELIFFFCSSVCVNLFVSPTRRTKKGSRKMFPSPTTWKFEHSVPVELIANIGISVRMSNQREETGHVNESSQEEGLRGELILSSWFYVPQASSLSYGPPRFSTHLWLSLNHWTPVLERGGISSALCSSPAQCLLWSGVKDFFPWLLVLQKALSPWSRVCLASTKLGEENLK